MISGYTISLSNGQTSTTTENGYYQFTGLDCTQTYTTSYADHPLYYEDSDQKDEKIQDSSTPSVTGSIVTPSEFKEVITNDATRANERLYWSENNNFGLVLYDLDIVKKVKTIRTNDIYVDTQSGGTTPLTISGTTVVYTLDVKNLGPTIARTITVSDYFDPSQMTITSVTAATLVAK